MTRVGPVERYRGLRERAKRGLQTVDGRLIDGRAGAV